MAIQTVAPGQRFRHLKILGPLRKIRAGTGEGRQDLGRHTKVCTNCMRSVVTCGNYDG